MINYHAVMIGEDGMEFGADVSAASRSEAYEKLRENYPESRVEQLESPEDTQRRESAMHAHIAKGGDWDEEGRPIFHGPTDDDYPECSECGVETKGGSLCDDCCEEMENA